MANNSNYHLLKGILEHADHYPADVVHIHSFMNKLKVKHEKAAQAQNTLSTAFASFTSIRSLDEDFLMPWVEGVSDLSLEDLKLARTKDKDATYLLASCGAQVPLAFRFPAELNSKQIMHSWLTLRHQKCGNRLANFKGAGCFGSDGKLNFLDKSYKLEWEPSPSTTLKHITHILDPGTEIASPGPWLTKTAEFENFWDDHSASVKITGMPKVLIHTYFGKALMKFKYAPCNLKCVEFKEEIKQVVDDHVKKANAVKVGSELSPLKADLKQLDQAEATAKMTAVLTQVQAKVAERRQKRRLSLDN